MGEHQHVKKVICETTTSQLGYDIDLGKVQACGKLPQELWQRKTHELLTHIRDLTYIG